jgi:hypothetical protein
MKLILLTILLYSTGINKVQTQHQLFKISTYTGVPKDFTGCGNAFYLSQKDKKAGKTVCVTHFSTALIYINNKPMRLTDNHKLANRGEHMYTSGNYTLITKLDHEYYITKGIMIIKYENKVIWSKKVIGGGGC